ncbi:30S ribosomal protein S16 [candidate division Kazan bacterium RBG_13_50_9]|uniref:Small ribosomal subunit protein bS16 n=1 Tax=candidate division Kazan bacterium RBG_13_50_9 TaxID=1798535 RepID=A0A1F4NRW8_UNCK3|nr:MAG: 30S ribosomal protein S16 [candidate division Kazan bacterium RBG_13_50_9]
MLVIRLSRRGRRNLPSYRILVAEHSKPTDGKFVEALGYYRPAEADQPLSVDKERAQYWLAQGARPSRTVARLLNRVGFNLPVEERHRAPKKLEQLAEAAAEVPTGAKAEPVPEPTATEPAPSEESIGPTPAPIELEPES